MAESEGVTRRFDPRFSPAFQPGYDPRVHREEPPSAPLRDEPSRVPTGSPSSGGTPGAQFRDGTHDERTLPSDDQLESGIREQEASEPVMDSVDGVDPAPWWRRFNPWLVALWVIGVVFILGGVWVANSVADWAENGRDGSTGSYIVSMMFQMAWFGVPMLIVLGLATLTSTVVILAARWRRP